MVRHAPALLLSVVALSIGVTATSCAPDVVGGTRDIDDCLCDCDLGCEGSGPRQDPDGAAGPQGAGGGGDQVVSVATTGGGAPGAGGAGQGGDAAEGGGCAGSLSVRIDDELFETCDADVTRDTVTEVVAVFADGHALTVRFTGREPAEDVCASVGLRAPGNDTGPDDWEVSGDCDVTISALDDRVVGSFAATLQPVSGGSLGPRVLSDGTFDVAP